MDTHPYHHYLFFSVGTGFYQTDSISQDRAKTAFGEALSQFEDLIITPYSTLGLTSGNTFMLWVRAQTPKSGQTLLRNLLRTTLGQWLTVSTTYFGITRPSVYSGRSGKPEQVMQNYPDRLPYFILYPFTKTHEWHLLDQGNRGFIMSQHMKVGLEFPDIRQCLLYSYGLDNQEFIVSYETLSLEDFQDLVIRMRSTIGRQYTLNDTPIYTCIYRPIQELMEWL